MERHLILGIDEVGRGPWAGPLVMGGCILPEHDAITEENSWIESLTDSKKLTIKKREELATVIYENALASATGWVHAAELNEIGLAAGLKLACRRVVENIQKQNITFHEIIIDGPQNFLAGTRLQRFVTNINKADLLIKEVSAGSIIAKVEHDHYMQDIAKLYPAYGFEKHVGYGTAKHIAAIKTYGITPEHRTFIRPISNLLGLNPRSLVAAKNTSKIGNLGEQAVAEYLVQNDHQVLFRNYKTKVYEIDIVSKKSDTLYFTEVKYRKTSAHGSGLEVITPAKLKQMTFAAELFMKAAKLDCSFRLAAAAVSGPDFHVDEWVEV